MSVESQSSVEEAPKQDLAAPKPVAEERKKTSLKGLVIAVLVVAVVLALIFMLGWLPRRERTQETRATARREESALAPVDVVKVKRSPFVSHLLLPGDITPLIEAPLYARASGYIVKRYVDIGDRVSANQLMATIDAPDLDQQVAQGRAALSQARQQLGQSQATLEQSQAQLELAKVTWDRYASLVTKGAVSRQDADQQKSNYETAAAVVNANKANVRASQDNVEAAQANLDRLISLQSFKEIRAPFAGVVTQRNVDVGSYVATNGSQSGTTSYSASLSLGSNGSAGQNSNLFSVAQIKTLRILIQVPQNDAPNIRVGQPADVYVQEFRNRSFPGHVTRTANALDPTSRTLLTEIQVDNAAQTLLPGMYATVQFSSPRADPPFLVPGDSLITRSDGAFVAVLQTPKGQKDTEEVSQAKASGQDLREQPKEIHLQKVVVGRDFGTDIEILSGLSGWEYVVANPSDEVYEGALVLPTSAKPTQAAPTQSASGKAGKSH
jgi:multidrug efflux pump subunit AcrA (membrane-fusion protein)